MTLVSQTEETLSDLAARWKLRRARLVYICKTRDVLPSRTIAHVGVYGPEEQRTMLAAMHTLTKRGRQSLRSWLERLREPSAPEPVIEAPAGQPVLRR